MARTPGISHRGEVTDPTANTITALTLAAWIRWDGFQFSTVIVGTNSGGPGGTWSHGLRIITPGKIEAYCFDGGGRSLPGATTIPANVWTHAAVTLQNGQPMKVYFNGALDATAGSNLATLYTGLDRWSIASSSGGTNIYTGDLAELALFRSVLTAGEIASLANGSKHPLSIATAPRWYLPLCGGAVTDTDNSANSLTFAWVAGGTPPSATHPSGIANVCGFAGPSVGSAQAYVWGPV